MTQWEAYEKIRNGFQSELGELGAELLDPFLAWQVLHDGRFESPSRTLVPPIPAQEYNRILGIGEAARVSRKVGRFSRHSVPRLVSNLNQKQRSRETAAPRTLKINFSLSIELR